MENDCFEQLKQLCRPIWDGDLISKTDRDQLVREGLAFRSKGYQLITKAGLDILIKLKVLKP